MTGTLQRAPLEALLVSPEASIRDAMVAIDRSGLEVALVCDARRRLVAMATDGDIRRAILRGASLDETIMVAANTSFTTVAPDVDRSEAMRIIQTHAEKFCRAGRNFPRFSATTCVTSRRTASRSSRELNPS